MTVGVAHGRSEIVRGHDPVTLALDAAHDHDAAEERQLVVGQAHRRAAERREDVLERVARHRRREAVADGRGAHRDAGLLAPGERREPVRQLGRDEDRVVGADDRLRRPRRGPARPAELGGLRQPVEGLVGAAQLRPSQLRRERVEERLEQRRPDGGIAVGDDDQRDPAFEQPPERRRESGIQQADPDQVDDRTG